MIHNYWKALKHWFPLRPMTWLPIVAAAAIAAGTLPSCGGGTSTVGAIAIADADSTYQRACDYYDQSNYEKAIDLAQVALGTYQRQRVDSSLSDCYSLQAACYQRLGMVDSGISLTIKGMEIDEKMGDKERLSSTYNNLAALYLTAGQPHDARVFIEKAIEIEESLEQPTKMSVRLGNAAEINLMLGNTDTALTLAHKALALDEAQHDTVKMARRLSVMGDILDKQNKTSEARQAYERAIHLLRQQGEHTSLMLTLQHLGRLLITSGDKAAGISHLEESNRLAEQAHMLMAMQQNHELLAQALSESDVPAAIEHMRLSNQLTDSLNKQATTQLTARFATQYKLKENEFTIAQQHSTMTTQRIIITLTAVGLVLLALMLLALIYLMRTRNAASGQVEHARHEREAFFERVIHELRNPLTIISGNAQTLKEKEGLGAKSQQQLSAIIGQSGLLLKHLEQLHDLARTDNDNIGDRWRNGDVVALTRLTMENLRTKAQEHSVNIDFVSEHDTIVMDFVPDYIYHIVTYLVNNAIKFTPRGGNVMVTLRNLDDKLQIHVADTGVGIPHDDIPHVFEAFHEGSSKLFTMGTGIELNMVKLMTEAMNGMVEVMSSEGKGSVFVVTLPLRHATGNYPKWIPTVLDTMTRPQHSEPAPAEPEENENDTAPDDSERAIALIVEDNPDVLRFIGAAIAPLKLRCISASNGQDGIDKAQEFIPDIILTDLMMPKVDGTELCRQVRANPLTSHIPIVVITAHNDDDTRIACFDAGADSFISKPFDSNVLRANIKQLLEQRLRLQAKYTHHDSDDASTGGNAMLEKLQQLISSHIASPELNSVFLADKMFLSQRQLNRKVKSLTGHDTTTHIREMRIALAKRLLAGTDQPISDVVVKCGFDSASYFAKIFKQSTGKTPTEYRNS